MKGQPPPHLRRLALAVFASILLACKLTLAVEVWEYSVKYLGITAVRAKAQIERVTYEGATPVDHLLLQAKSTKLYSLLYRVDNEYETFIDVRSGYPLRYLRRIDEGSIQGSFATNFYQEQRKAIYDSVDEVTLCDRSHDFFSAILFLRRQELKLGDIYTFTLNLDRFDWEATVNVAEQREYKIDGERLPAKVLEVRFRYLGPKPKPKIDTDILTYYLVDEKTKLKILFSDDENRLPLRMEYCLWPFSVKAYLNHLPK